MCQGHIDINIKQSGSLIVLCVSLINRIVLVTYSAAECLNVNRPFNAFKRIWAVLHLNCELLNTCTVHQCPLSLRIFTVISAFVPALHKDSGQMALKKKHIHIPTECSEQRAQGLRGSAMIRQEVLMKEHFLPKMSIWVQRILLLSSQTKIVVTTQELFSAHPQGIIIYPPITLLYSSSGT